MTTIDKLKYLAFYKGKVESIEIVDNNIVIKEKEQVHNSIILNKDDINNIYFSKKEVGSNLYFFSLKTKMGTFILRGDKDVETDFLKILYFLGKEKLLEIEKRILSRSIVLLVFTALVCLVVLLMFNVINFFKVFIYAGLLLRCGMVFYEKSKFKMMYKYFLK